MPMPTDSDLFVFNHSDLESDQDFEELCEIPVEKGGRGSVLGKGEGPREYWEKVQVLWICRGVGVFPSRVISNEYRS